MLVASAMGLLAMSTNDRTSIVPTHTIDSSCGLHGQLSFVNQESHSLHLPNYYDYLELHCV